MKIAALKEETLAFAQELAEEFGMFSPGDDRLTALGAWQDERLAGVCLGRLGQTGVAELMFVHVNGLFRGKGIARDLVEKWKLGAQRAGMHCMVAEYITGNGQTDPSPFLEALGFSDLRRGETLFSTRLDVLGESEWSQPSGPAAQGFVRLSDMSQSAFSQLGSTMRRDLPQFATLQSVRGELLRDLSWVLQDKSGMVRLSLLFSREGGVLYLHSLYCEKGWQQYMLPLIHLALSEACAQADHYERIYVTCINEASSRIVQRIVRGLPHQQRTAWRMYLQL